jgi:hypothetical protein
LGIDNLLARGGVPNTFYDNGREATVNRAIYGSTYPNLKLLPSSPWKKKDLVVKKHNSLYLRLETPGNTKGGSLTVPLTSRLIALE